MFKTLEGMGLKSSSNAPDVVDAVAMTAALVSIPVEQIEPCSSANPRIGDNPKYESLKSALRGTAGQYLVLDVAQRPGTDCYETRRGGITRLTIARELDAEYRASGSPNPFATIKCIVHPWTSDEDQVTAHVTENMARGELCFAEEARAIGLLHDQFVQRTGDESQHGLAEYLVSLGIPLAQSTISRMLQTNQICSYFHTRLIGGRANQTYVRALLNAKSAAVKNIKSRLAESTNQDDEREVMAEAQNLGNQWFIESLIEQDGMDTEVVSVVGEMEKRISAHFVMTPTDGSTDADPASHGAKFAARYELNGSHADFTDDARKNSAVLINELITAGHIEGSARKTRKIRQMGADNTVDGFLALFRQLDKTGRKMVTRMLLEVP